MFWTYLCLVIGKFGVSCNFQIVYFIITEIFPTEFRGTVFGIANMFGRMGGILAPIIDGFAENSFMTIFGIFGLVSGVSSLFLKETKGVAMADNLEQR